jgi:hypothetical protein
MQSAIARAGGSGKRAYYFDPIPDMCGEVGANLVSQNDRLWNGAKDAAGWYDRFEPNSGRRRMSQKYHMRTTPPAVTAAKSPMSFLGPGTSI